MSSDVTSLDIMKGISKDTLNEAMRNGFIVMIDDYYVTDVPWSFRDIPPSAVREARERAESDVRQLDIEDAINNSLAEAQAETQRISDMCYQAMELYNQTAKKIKLSKCKLMTSARKRAIALRLKEIGGLEGWKEALAKLEKSSFCQGKNDRGWKASMDFLLQPSKLAKLLEGGYEFEQKKPERTEFQRLLDNI